jgi:hypothetical protein
MRKRAGARQRHDGRWRLIAAAALALTVGCAQGDKVTGPASSPAPSRGLTALSISLAGNLTIRPLSATSPAEIEVAFQNRGPAPIQDSTVEQACDYFVDGLRHRRVVLWVISCLGGCPSVQPGDTYRFDVPLTQLVKLTRDGGGSPSRGVHRVRVACGQLWSNEIEAYFAGEARR